MPTVLYKYGCRFFFYSNEHLPQHIHVEKENKTPKFNLSSVELVSSYNFNSKELREICILVEENVQTFKLKWDEFFNYQ